MPSFQKKDLRLKPYTVTSQLLSWSKDLKLRFKMLWAFQPPPSPDNSKITQFRQPPPTSPANTKNNPVWVGSTKNDDIGSQNTRLNDKGKEKIL